MIKIEDSDRVEEFGKNMQNVIRRVFHEAAGLARYVYEECFVKGKNVEELMTDDQRMSEALFGMYMLFIENQEETSGYMS